MDHRRGAMLPVWGAYVIACVALGISAYGIWLEPARTRTLRELSESNREVARATIQLTEWLDAQEKRYAKEGRVK